MDEEQISELVLQFIDVRGGYVAGASERELFLMVKQAVVAERERCAQIAEAPFGPGLAERDDYWQPRIAAAIRAQA